MPRPKTSTSDRLKAAYVALGNAESEPEIATKLAPYGFGPERIARFRTIYDEALAAVQQQTALGGKQRAATAAARKAEVAANAAYQEVAGVARTVLGKDKGALTGLALDQPAPRTSALLLTRALALLDNTAATPAIAERLAAHGITADTLAARRKVIVAFADALRAQEAAKGLAQQASADARASLEAVDEEMRVLRGLARVALRDRPELVEVLGIFKRTVPTAKQRQAPKKAAATRLSKKDQAASNDEPTPEPA